jgi:hypothetical protein
MTKLALVLRHHAGATREPRALAACRRCVIALCCSQGLSLSCNMFVHSVRSLARSGRGAERNETDRESRPVGMAHSGGSATASFTVPAAYNVLDFAAYYRLYETVRGAPIWVVYAQRWRAAVPAPAATEFAPATPPPHTHTHTRLRRHARRLGQAGRRRGSRVTLPPSRGSCPDGRTRMSVVRLQLPAARTCEIRTPPACGFALFTTPNVHANPSARTIRIFAAGCNEAWYNCHCGADWPPDRAGAGHGRAHGCGRPGGRGQAASCRCGGRRAGTSAIARLHGGNT